MNSPFKRIKYWAANILSFIFSNSPLSDNNISNAIFLASAFASLTVSLMTVFIKSWWVFLIFATFATMIVWLVLASIMFYVGVIRSFFSDFRAHYTMKGWELLSKSVPVGEVFPDLGQLDWVQYGSKYNEYKTTTIEKINASVKDLVGHEMICIHGYEHDNSLRVYYLFDEDLEKLKEIDIQKI